MRLPSAYDDLRDILKDIKADNVRGVRWLPKNAIDHMAKLLRTVPCRCQERKAHEGVVLEKVGFADARFSDDVLVHFFKLAAENQAVDLFLGM